MPPSDSYVSIKSDDESSGITLVCPEADDSQRFPKYIYRRKSLHLPQVFTHAPSQASPDFFRRNLHARHSNSSKSSPSSVEAYHSRLERTIPAKPCAAKQRLKSESIILASGFLSPVCAIGRYLDRCLLRIVSHTCQLQSVRTDIQGHTPRSRVQ